MKKFKLILNITLILFISISKSYSLVEVDITRGNLNPLPIAVSPLFQDNNSNTFFEKELEIEDIGSEISKVIENNLKQSFEVSFVNRPKDEIDDIVAFFESLGGVSKFQMTIDDTNGNETIKVICRQWNQTWAYDDFYSATANFRRVYEA